MKEIIKKVTFKNESQSNFDINLTFKMYQEQVLEFDKILICIITLQCHSLFVDF